MGGCCPIHRRDGRVWMIIMCAANQWHYHVAVNNIDGWPECCPKCDGALVDMSGNYCRCD